MTNRFRYLAPFLAGGAGLLAGHLAASAAAAVTWLEVETRIATATANLERLEKAVAANVASEAPEPAKETQPSSPAPEPIRGPVEMESSSVAIVGNTHDRKILFGWEIRLVNRGNAPDVFGGQLYLADTQGAPVRELEGRTFVVHPGCPRVIRGMVAVRDICYGRTYARVTISKDGTEIQATRDRIKATTRSGCS